MPDGRSSSVEDSNDLVGNFSDDVVLEFLPTAVCVCDAEGAVLRHNRKATELWTRAITPLGAEQTSDHLYQPFSADDAAAAPLRAIVKQAIENGGTQSDVALRIGAAGGVQMDLLADVEPLRDAAGAINGAVCCLRPAPPRWAERTDLLASGSLLRAIIDTTPECVKLVAPDGTLMHMNMAGLRMVEAEGMDEVQGANTLDLIAPEDRARWKALHERVCAGERLEWEFDVIGLRGSRRHMETHAAPLRLPDGEVVQLAITRDLTLRKSHEKEMQEAALRSLLILESLPIAVYTTDAEGRVTFYNEAAAALAGRRPVVGVDEWCVTARLLRPDGSHLPHDQCPMAMALKERRPIYGAEAVAERPDGTEIPFLAYPTPFYDSDGRLQGAVNVLVDITDRKQAEEYAHRLASIVQSSDDAIIGKNIDGIITSWNYGAERLFGYRAEEAIGKPVRMLIPPDREDEAPGILRRIRNGERVDHYETVRRRKDGTLLDISLTVSPVVNASGKIIGASKIARNITARKREEDHRRLLVNELNHRVKNTLATVQSIAALTLRGEGGAEAVRYFEGRLMALSRAHNVLTEESWVSADLHDIVEQAFAPIAGGAEDRFRADGPLVRLKPQAALSLAMALHELCTNAAKYGAFKSAAGQVRVAWSVSGTAGDSVLHLDWNELGGPPVEPPARTGFGTRMIERVLVRDLGAKVKLDYLSTGVQCHIEVPLR